MTDIQTQVTQAVTKAEAEAKTLRERVVAYVKAHIPHTVVGVASYVGGHFGILGAVLKHVL